jgi:hypothetical protein
MATKIDGLPRCCPDTSIAHSRRGHNGGNWFLDYNQVHEWTWLQKAGFVTPPYEVMNLRHYQIPALQLESVTIRDNQVSFQLSFRPISSLLLQPVWQLVDP